MKNHSAFRNGSIRWIVGIVTMLLVFGCSSSQSLPSTQIVEVTQVIPVVQAVEVTKIVPVIQVVQATRVVPVTRIVPVTRVVQVPPAIPAATEAPATEAPIMLEVPAP